MIRYEQDLVHTPGTGTIETASGKLDWTVKFYRVQWEYTGNEVPDYCDHFSPYDCGCAPGDTIQETRVIKKERISKEDYDYIKEYGEENV